MPGKLEHKLNRKISKISWYGERLRERGPNFALNQIPRLLPRFFCFIFNSSDFISRYNFDMYLTPFCNVSHKSLKGLRILARFFSRYKAAKNEWCGDIWSILGYKKKAKKRNRWSSHLSVVVFSLDSSTICSAFWPSS